MQQGNLDAEGLVIRDMEDTSILIDVSDTGSEANLRGASFEDNVISTTGESGWVGVQAGDGAQVSITNSSFTGNLGSRVLIRGVDGGMVTVSMTDLTDNAGSIGTVRMRSSRLMNCRRF